MITPPPDQWRSPLKLTSPRMTGRDVAAWQRICGAKDDGDFGPVTDRLTRAWQAAHGLTADGLVGPKTRAMIGFEEPVPLGDADTDPPPALPGPPHGLRALSGARAMELYGARPPPGEHGVLAWEHANLVTIHVPELIGVLGAAPGGAVRCHERVAEPLAKLFDAWRRAELDHLVKAWGGCYADRAVRGGTALSNHAYGAAIDINAPWNPLGKPPAPRGATGSVVDLVPIAAEHGWFWGGWYAGRADGMHFELSEPGWPA